MHILVMPCQTVFVRAIYYHFKDNIELASFDSIFHPVETRAKRFGIFLLYSVITG